MELSLGREDKKNRTTHHGMARLPPVRCCDGAGTSGRPGLFERIIVDADATVCSAMARGPFAATARLIILSVTMSRPGLHDGKSPFPHVLHVASIFVSIQHSTRDGA